jgi:hypothetical protein
MRKAVRGIDLVCRMGGEEFVVVMPETDLALAMRVGERIRQAIASQPFAIRQGQGELSITTSVGVAAFEQAGRHAGNSVEAGRPGALFRQAGWPEPRRRGCSLILQPRDDCVEVCVELTSKLYVNRQLRKNIKF